MNKKLIISIFLSCFMFFFVCGCAVNPITGEQQFMLVPEGQDAEIGSQYAPQIEKEMGGRIDDPVLQNYVNEVGQKIIDVSHFRDYDYTFVALDHNSVNAFALPGGYIFITRGMLEQLNSEAQLAAILAHETVHVVARHSSARLSQQIGIDLLLAVALDEGTSQGTRTVINYTRQIIGLKYNRSQERQADEAGMDYLVKAGYHPKGMVETMQILQRQSNSRTIEFLSSHPSPENREEYLLWKIEDEYPRVQGKIGGEEYKKSVLDRLK